VKAVFTTYLLTTHWWVGGLLVGRLKKKKATELTTVVNSGTETQPKTVLWPLTIHPSWCLELESTTQEEFNKGNPPSQLGMVCKTWIWQGWVSLAWRQSIILYQTGKGVNQKAQSSPEPEPSLHAIK